jgi:cyclopropane-fatty-acyl-phospholipid synthase
LTGALAPSHSCRNNADLPVPQQDKRLDAARRLFAHLGEKLGADLEIRLWNGERVPLGPSPSGDLALALNSPDALTRAIRRPRLTTLIELIAAGDITIEGGTLLDLAARRGSMDRKGLLRRLDKRLLLGALLPFLFHAPKTATASHASSHAYSGAEAAKDSKGRDNKPLIQFHYDLSNEFYGLFLDPEMVYSCAYFPDWNASLEEAQRAKLEMICRKLRLQPGERFLDIGCGWGGLICHAAQHHAVTAHGVTLSQAQLDFARAKIGRLGLQDRVTVELKDYKELSGEYDKIASIGMFEHVGLDNHAAYFQHMRSLLRPRGLLLNHAIARPAKKDMKTFRRKRPEFAALTKYIFPGGELDYIGLSLTNLERHGFEVHDVEGWREHYGRTCRLWTERLHANRAAAEREVGAGRTRLWLLYLAGCALAFERGSVGIFQTLVSKRARGPSGLPPTRADLYR